MQSTCTSMMTLLSNFMKRITFIKLSSAGLLILASNLIPGLLSLPIIQLLLTLVVVPIAIYLVASTCIPVYLKSILAVVTFIINDILLKIFLFVPSKDISGELFILLVVDMLAILISTIVFFTCIRKDFKIYKWITASSFFFFCLASAFYLYLLGYKKIHSLGTPASRSIMLSQKRGIFISKLNIRNPLIILQKDTFILKNAWIEKELTIKRRPLISQIKETGRYRIAVKFDHHIEDWGYSNKFTFYPARNRSRGAFLFPGGLFSFITDSLANEYPVTFVRLKKDSVTFILFRSPE
jgi:hypothetical protein